MPVFETVYDTSSVKVATKSNDVPRLLVSGSRPPLQMPQLTAVFDEKFGGVEIKSVGSVGAKVVQILEGHAQGIPVVMSDTGALVELSNSRDKIFELGNLSSLVESLKYFADSEKKLQAAEILLWSYFVCNSYFLKMNLFLDTSTKLNRAK